VQNAIERVSSLYLKAGPVSVAAWLAIELAIADDAQPVNAVEYKRVQAAKLVHRMASGTHEQWDQPTLSLRADGNSGDAHGRAPRLPKEPWAGVVAYREGHT
jgi:hypothetical protein